MILLLQPDGSVVLEQATDFRRFHCEIAAGVDGLEQARALFRMGEIADAETAWIDEEKLYALGASSEGPGWRDQARTMVAAAARFGWVREQPPRIKSHIVWRR